MTLEEALLVADHGGDCRAAIQVLAVAVRTLTADRDSWAEQASQRAQDALDLVAAERERWESAIGAEMPAGFKDWHQNSTTERPTVAAWVIRNLREREAEASAAERERWRAWVEEAVNYVGCETWSPSLREEGERLLGLKV